MMAVARTMFGTVLPNAATIAIARTKSGKAMMVSATRQISWSTQPPKKPEARPAKPPAAKTSRREAQRDGGRGDAEVEPRRHQDAGEDVPADLVGAEPVLRARRLQG